jgi:hypothetical protein
MSHKTSNISSQQFGEAFRKLSGLVKIKSKKALKSSNSEKMNLVELAMGSLAFFTFSLNVQKVFHLLSRRLVEKFL